jgi:RNA polymerase sigma-70 factor (ECF subfamily)
MLRSGRSRTAEPLTKLFDGEEVMIEVPDSSETPEHMMERKEKIKIILHSIEKLSDIYREAIILRDIQGFSYDQIAKILNCSEGAVKSRINRARTSLREILTRAMA